MPDPSPLTGDLLVIGQLSDVQALAATMWSEAAGDSAEGHSSVEERLAVGCVIRTRVANYRAFGAAEQSFRGVTLAHNDKGTWQFDCWRPNSGANHARLMAQAERLLNGLPLDSVLGETLFLAGGVISGVVIDRTSGANFYYAPKSMVPPGTVPVWAKGKTPTAQIGSQLFYKL